MGVWDQKYAPGTQVHGHRVLNIEELKENQEEYTILVTSKYCMEEIEEFLFSKGIVKNVLFVHKNEVLKAFTKLDSYNQYFDEIITYENEEVFVDEGSLDGENSFEFCERCPDYKRIVAFEPDQKNYERCKCIGNNLESFEVINKGLWNKKETLYFTSKDGSSRISTLGDCKIETESLDDVLQEEKVTFIKMDIEGAEYNALIGAENSIKNGRQNLQFVYIMS